MNLVKVLGAVFARKPVDPAHDRVEWRGEIPNWLVVEGEEDAVDPGQEGIAAKFVTNRGHGGASIILDTGEGGEIEVHVEMRNGGPALRVYIPKREEPALRARLLPRCVLVDR